MDNKDIAIDIQLNFKISLWDSIKMRIAGNPSIKNLFTSVLYNETTEPSLKKYNPESNVILDNALNVGCHTKWTKINVTKKRKL